MSDKLSFYMDCVCVICFLPFLSIYCQHAFEVIPRVESAGKGELFKFDSGSSTNVGDFPNQWIFELSNQRRF